MLSYLGLPALLALFSTEQSCEMEIACELLAVGWSHTSAYIIAVIGYDRFLHMKYLNRYKYSFIFWTAHGFPSEPGVANEILETEPKSCLAVAYFYS